jgi:hypothetical protein
MNGADFRYAVFPERLEVMAQSNLLKVAGRVGGDLVTIEGRVRESGWALIMPESTEAVSGSPTPQTPLGNMMRWVTGFHDVFGLYGRPERYNWNLQEPKSLFFAYPQGPDRSVSLLCESSSSQLTISDCSSTLKMLCSAISESAVCPHSEGPSRRSCSESLPNLSSTTAWATRNRPHLEWKVRTDCHHCNSARLPHQSRTTAVSPGLSRQSPNGRTLPAGTIPRERQEVIST